MQETATKQQKNAPRWDRTALDAAARTFRVGANALIEFIREHHEGDILRELVQNEYDARGRRMTVSFGQESLRVAGSGDPIDPNGWKRLKVVFGTGAVAGDDEDIPPKVNSIGSKNFGLRTLFLFGDRIYIRSSGSQTMLSIDGVSDRLPDSQTQGQRGVEIEVPYRTAPFGKLLAFDTAREREALDVFATQLGPMLIKLAQPRGRSLESLTVSSTRHDTLLHWRQTAKDVRTLNNGVRVIHRRGLLQATGQIHQRTARQELEYQRTITVPENIVIPDFPAYYRVGTNRARLGCSFAIKKGLPDLKERGIFYYPLGASAGFTGNAVSVSAPFEMNTARTALIDPGQSPWNAWLLSEAAQFTCDLLAITWFHEFGSSAYRAAATRDDASVEGYADRIMKALSEEALWPTRTPARRTEFVKANQLVVPAAEIFDGLLGPEQYLHDRLCTDAHARQLAVDCGASTFTMNSVIRLRCVAEDRSDLETSLTKGEANYHYTAFPSELQNSEVQSKFARVFDAQQLSRSNRLDLRNSPTTLAADGGLQSPTTLWIVPPELLGVARIPQSYVLHPKLVVTKTLPQLCKTFSIAVWVRHTAQQLQTADEPTRLALYRQILSHWRSFSDRTITLLRGLPVLRDHEGMWQKPADLTIRSAPFAALFTGVLHFPHRDFARDAAFAQELHFKNEVDANDVVALARFVASDPDRAEPFEAFLDQARARTLPEELGNIPFLRCTDTLLHAPRGVYLPNTLNNAALGDTGLFPAGTRMSLYERLGCRGVPKASDILQHLATLRLHGQVPLQPELLYPALVDAMQRERIATASVRSQAIIWTGTAYATPEEALLGNRHSRVFLRSVPQLTGLTTRLENALRALGVAISPQPLHWRHLFAWFAAKYQERRGPVTQAEAAALRSAYGRLESLPDEIATTDCCLLDDRGYLHPLADVSTARYVIDDDREIRNALDAANVGIGFADAGAPETRAFYASVGVRNLSDVQRGGNITLGRPLRSPGWFDSSALRWVRSREFAYALAQVVAKHAASIGQRGLSFGTIRERLAHLQRVRFCDAIQVDCTVGGHQVEVQKKRILTGGTFVIAGVPLQREFLQLLGRTVTEVVWNGPPPQALISPTIALVDLQDEHLLGTYLEMMGIRYNPAVARRQRLKESTTDDAGLIKDSIIAELVQSLGQKPLQYFPAKETNTAPRKKLRDPLPALEEVVIEERALTKRLKMGRSSRSPSGVSRVPIVPDELADRELGRHAEALVFEYERQRVTEAGHDPTVVVWNAKDDPNNAADHDITSVDDDGECLWIEVKATARADGSFRWTRGEFERAVQARKRYMLYRVYEARSKRPTIKRFRDPIGLLTDGELRIDVASLSAQVEPLN
jgi:hypothetical protein